MFGFRKRTKPAAAEPESFDRRWWRIPSTFLYPLTICWDLLLLIDLVRPDPLPFVEELVMVVIGIFLNRSAVRRFRAERRQLTPGGDRRRIDER